MPATRTTVLVTGSTGLLGRHVVRELADAGHRVIGLDRDEDEATGHVAMCLHCDLADDESVRRAFDLVRERTEGPIPSLVHLAAYYDFSGDESPLYDQVTVEGTRRVLRGAQRVGVGQFVFSSSILALRPAEEGQMLDESSPERAEWAYPQSKLDAERVLRTERGGMPVVVLRIAGCYDAWCHSIPIAAQIRRIRERQFKSVFFPGDPGHGQSFVHVEDVARCVRAVVGRRESLADDVEHFLVAEPTWLSYAELQDLIGELVHDREWATIRVPGTLAKAGAWIEDKVGRNAFIKPWMIDLADAHYPVDASRARRVLGWQPLHRLPDVLPLMVENMRRDQARWDAENAGAGTDDDEHEAAGDKERPGQRTGTRAGGGNMGRREASDAADGSGPATRAPRAGGAPGGERGTPTREKPAPSAGRGT
jgi:nucleoside-diphosphate-sugar epimerase